MEGSGENQTGGPQEPGGQPEFGKEIAHEGVKDLIGEMRQGFTDQQNQEINDKVKEVMESDLPTAGAVEAALSMQDNQEKILFLAVFAQESVAKALEGVEHDPESADKFAGFYMDSLGQILQHQAETQQEPPSNP